MKIRVLFICHGNICRSPMGEFILKYLIESSGMKDYFFIASRATSYEEIYDGTGNPIYPPAAKELKRHHIGETPYTSFDKKRAEHLSSGDYDYFDFLLCADHYNIKNTLSIVGKDAKNKVHLILDYSSRKGEDISDPWYTGDFKKTYDDLLEGCTSFLEYLKANNLIK